MKKPWLACCIALAVGVAANADDTYRTLAASHIGIVTVTGMSAVTEGRMRIAVAIDYPIRGGWRFSAEVDIAFAERAGTLAKGDQLLVYCEEAIEPSRGVIYYSDADSIVRLHDPAAQGLVEDTRRIVEQMDSLLQRTRRQTSSNGSGVLVSNLVDMLLVKETQRSALKKMLELPATDNVRLAEYVYDFRRIPAGLLSPDDPIVFDQSPTRQCRYIHDVIVWMLQLKTGKYFGHGNERSTLERRLAVGESWQYWIAYGQESETRRANR